MKKKILFIFIAIAICLSTIFIVHSIMNTNPMPSSISTPEDLERYIEQGISFDDIDKLISNELVTMFLPAQDIYQEGTTWHFIPLKVGSPGDRNAPYNILVCYPKGSITNPYYIVFFKDELVIGDAWFEWETTTNIMKLLWTTETTD